MKFEPDSVTVEAGETVRFVVTNAGNLMHSFTLGSPAYQKRHEKQMADMPRDKMAGHMSDSANGMVIEAGATGELTWRFERGGRVQFACHIPGHYAAGMKGKIRFEKQ
jgi:uncharacterized cupredoxin-like copper-binding protein